MSEGMKSGFRVALAVMLPPMLAAWIGSGCGKSASLGGSVRPTKVDLPLWFTTPETRLSGDVPVSLGVNLPTHLEPLAKTYALPNWVIYGVVRSLGSREFLANGTYRSFSVADERGESRVVVDDIYYDVPMEQAREILAGIARECVDAANERERLDVLGSFVRYRFGGLVLFSLERQTGNSSNLLLTSGKSNDPVETFEIGNSVTMPLVGWKEEGGYTVTTMVGPFHYGNAELSFRRVEEESIRDLAKGLMFKFSHIDKSFVEGGVKVSEDVKEETVKEEITLRMRGVTIRRRVVDMERGLCLVEVCVPINGVALQ